MNKTYNDRTTEKISSFHHPVSVEDMMKARDRRAALQSRLIQNFGLPVVSFTLNIPGPVKILPGVPDFFDRGADAVKQALEKASVSVVFEEEIREHTGYELFLCADASPERLKEITVPLEEESKAGRLYDIDIIRTDGSKVSREELNFPSRCCLLCGEPAHACSRSRRHTVEELVAYICHLIDEDSFLEYLFQAARDSLLDEVSATPKPGLVDKNDNGAHQDMCYETFLRSTDAVAPYMKQMAEQGLSCHNETPQVLFSRIRKTGIEAEKAMFSITGGVNTHKGMIFSMGILSACAGYLYGRGEAIRTERLFSMAKELCGQEIQQDFSQLETFKQKTVGKLEHSAKPLSHGEKLYLTYGLRGIRGEAADGFPSLTDISLPVFLTSLTELERNDPEENSDERWNRACLQTLLSLMAQVEDTNIFHRGGPDAAAYVKEQAIQALADGGALDAQWRDRLSSMNQDFIKKNISPGGCADLLALTVFLFRLVKMVNQKPAGTDAGPN